MPPIKPPIIDPPIGDAPPTAPAAPSVAPKLARINELVNRRIAAKAAGLVVAEDKITEYIKAKKSLPIVLLTCNRPQLLQNTVASLLAVRGVTKEQVLVAQDGAMKEVADLVRASGIALIQNNVDERHMRGLDGGARIAQHYRYALSAAFDRTPAAPAVIVVEDDLLFSPDFLEYFQSAASILDEDAGTFVVSAWSDNGFKGKARDPLALRRTDYFPGLGWLLTRRLYKSELEANWPREHWDHWLRSAAVNKNREIVFPQVCAWRLSAAL